jgi:HNH endonuclease
MTGRLATSKTQRFAEKCKPAESGCINWTGATTRNGYGIFHVGPGKRMQVAHRFAFESANGPIAAGLDVCHHCDNRRCVNLAHLFSGTRRENMADAVRKGRTSHVPRVMGETHPMAVLTEKEVRQMREWHAAGWPKREISNTYGVTFSQVSRIVNLQSWKHV